VQNKIADHKLQLWSFISTSECHWCSPQLLVTGYSSAHLSTQANIINL